MQATLDNGVKVTKTLTLSPTGHLHQLSYRFQNPTEKSLELEKWSWGWRPGLGTSLGELKENARLTRALTLGKLKIHVIKPTANIPEFGRWAAIEPTGIVPRGLHSKNASSGGTGRRRRQGSNPAEPSGNHAAATAWRIGFGLRKLYVGPKGLCTALKRKYDRSLEESVDFGTFTGLGKLIYLERTQPPQGPHRQLWRFDHSSDHRHSAAKFMFPLTVKSFKATLAMKKLQPKIAELQARFKSDPKRLNIEMMNLYKSSGTNPFGGCLPMLLQLPIFWALFTTLRNAYELRDAPFVGWIHDLSTPDVLAADRQFPAACASFNHGRGDVHAAAHVRRLLRPYPEADDDDDAHQCSTFMFYGFPAGLVLYWLTNNLMTMGIQWSFQRLNQDPSRVIETTIVK